MENTMITENNILETICFSGFSILKTSIIIFDIEYPIIDLKTITKKPSIINKIIFLIF